MTKAKTATRAPLSEDLRYLKSLAAAAGGNRTIADAIHRGGVDTLDEAVRLVLGDARRYVSKEGAPNVESMLLRNGRRSWGVLRDSSSGRYVPLVMGPVGRPRNVAENQIQAWFTEAKALLKPIRAKLRRDPGKDRTAAVQRILDEAGIRKRVEAAVSVSDLIEGLGGALIPLDELAAKLVVSEHPEAGAPSSVIRTAKGPQSR